jgi:TMEM175 potassium channel family protein
MRKRRAPSRLFRVAEMPTSRIEAFSDGVFAIVITLLILSIQVPPLQGRDISLALAAALRGMVPKFLSYALSFAIASVWWVAHHHLFALLTKSDRGLLWLNSMFLFWLASVPFPTALLGDYPRELIAVVAYGAVMMMAGVSFSLMRFYAFYIGKLTAPGLDHRLLRRAMIKSMLNPVLHLAAILLAWVNTTVSLSLYAVIPILFFVPTRLEHYTASTKPE